MNPDMKKQQTALNLQQWKNETIQLLEHLRGGTEADPGQFPWQGSL